MFLIFYSFVDINNFMQATKFCNNITQAKVAIKHSSLVGVCDPTGCIPGGLVFLTGFGKQPPSQTFLTRVSCCVLRVIFALNVRSIQSETLFVSRHVLKVRTV